jgi:shikimate kinase
MIKENPRRIAIIGLPGSGKSTFSIKLGKLLNIPVYHLDRHVFDGRKKREKTLIKYLWYFNRDKKESIEALSKRYPEVEFIVFYRSHDLDKYLEKLEG